MKICSVCKVMKELGDFNRKGPGHQPKCRNCQKSYYSEYYKTDKEKDRVRRSNKAMRARIQRMIEKAKDRPCADCGLSFPQCVMDFDHLYDKEFTIGTDRYRVSLSALQQEIDKCEVVCANCHRLRTFARRVAGIPS